MGDCNGKQLIGFSTDNTWHKCVYIIVYIVYKMDIATHCWHFNINLHQHDAIADADANADADVLIWWQEKCNFCNPLKDKYVT